LAFEYIQVQNLYEERKKRSCGKEKDDFCMTCCPAIRIVRWLKLTCETGEAGGCLRHQISTLTLRHTNRQKSPANEFIGVLSDRNRLVIYILIMYSSSHNLMTRSVRLAFNCCQPTFNPRPTVQLLQVIPIVDIDVRLTASQRTAMCL